jgi:MFS family permease
VPINGLGTSELEARIGEKQRAEAFSCYQAATMIGGGLGAVINGILVGLIGAWNIPYLSVGLFSMLAAGLAIAAHHGGRQSGSPWAAEDLVVSSVAADCGAASCE